MPGDIVTILVSIVLLVHLPDVVVTQSYGDVGGQDADNFERFQSYEQTGPSSGLQTNGPASDAMSLSAILNTPVRDVSEMCPRQNVLMFFATGDVNHLRLCVPHRNVTTGMSLPSQEVEVRNAQAQPEPVGETYSGRLLKRILQNIGEGTVKVNLPTTESHGTEKRSRLSVSGAMGSLVNMLRQESRGHRRPLSAFHQELLHMG